MEEQEHEQGILNILDEMLNIVEGRNEQSKKARCDATPSLVNKKGKVNEHARQKLIDNINLMKTMLKEDNPSAEISYTIQLYTPHQVSTDSTKMFCECLAQILTVIKFQIVEEQASLQKHLPLLLVCPSVSRLEPSVDSALDGFKWDESFKVILLNFVTEKCLPAISSKMKVPLKPAYKNIEFIDMAFNKDDKLYECEMNNTALSKIMTFVETKRNEETKID